MKKQVSPAQVEALFKFFRSKYVHYYDVQIELVDHFASAIEAMWDVLFLKNGKHNFPSLFK